MTAPAQIHELVDQFERDRHSLAQDGDNEFQLRQSFVNPFFAALGWDVGNRRQVLHETALKSGGSVKHPDYTFLAGKRRAFYVETKRPAIDISKSVDPALQLRSYGWSGNTAVGILTNFAEFAVYDCRINPQQGDLPAKARILYLTSAQYVDHWRQLHDTLSYEAVQQGKHRSILDAAAKGVLPVDAAFLRDMEGWRSVLAKELHKQALFVGKDLSQRELNLLVQRTIDRIVFLRIVEDRNPDEYGRLERIAQGHNVYQQLKNLYRAADAKYNSGLFHFERADKSRPEADTLSMAIYIPDEVLRNIIYALYPPQSRYQFSVISADILGQVYERFLGKVIEVLSSDHETSVSVVEKPEVRKAGGVYYTPEYIVDYIVENTLGKLLENATPKEAAKLRVLDPACGSGSFLAGAYQYLLDWHLDFYSQNPRKHKNVLRSIRGSYVLKIPEKRRILLNSIYGVDLDQNAVEVSKLSLLLKMLENEDGASGVGEEDGPILPDLRDNIKWGNSLVGSDFYDGADVGGLSDDELQRVMAFDWDGAGGFADIMAAGGFEAVIGNPPYVRQETLGRDFKAYAKTTYDTYAGTADLYTYFIEQSHKLLKKTGRYGVICSNKFLRSAYGKGIRQFLTKRAAIEQLIDFGELPVFADAATFPLILITKRGKHANNQFIYAPVKRLDFTSLSEEVRDIHSVLDDRSIEGDRWTLASKEMVDVLDWIREVGTPLEEYTDSTIYFGLKTGFNRAFVLDRATRDSIVSDCPQAAGLIRPFALGDDIRKYTVNFNERYLIVIPKGWTQQQLGHAAKKPEAWLWFSKTYPALANHLQQFECKAQKRRDQGDYWWELRACDYYSALEKPKIIYPDIAKESRVAFDTTGIYVTNTVWLLPTDDMYLLGVLNSSLIFNYFKHFASVLGDAHKGGRLRWFRQDVLKLPIRAIDFDDPADVAMHDEMVGLVERMLALHKGYARLSDPQRQVVNAQIERVDRQIDALVYRLYGLSDEEVGVVEGG